MTSLSSMLQLFDRILGRQRRLRCDTHRIVNHPLHQDLYQMILERLSFMKRSFETILLIGDFPVDLLQTAFPNAHIYTLNTTSEAMLHGDVEFLPFKKNCADLVISYFDLHTVNDIPGTLLQMKDILEPDGLFLGIMLGGDSLWQLRQVCHLAEEKVRGGVSPRIAPMIALHDAAALMQRAGFALPVVDHDVMERYYNSALAILKDLQNLGLSNILRDRDRAMMTFELLHEILTTYHGKFKKNMKGIPCDFDVIFLSGWGPAPDQQRPLLPGSAQMRLCEVV